MAKSGPISYVPIPSRGVGHCALDIYPPGTFMNNTDYAVFVGGCGLGHRNTLAEAERYLLEQARLRCDQIIADATRTIEHYTAQRRVLAHGLKRAPKKKAK